MSKTIAILGATGSVGIQAQQVARARGYKIDLITAGSNYKAAEAAAREFRPRVVAMADEMAALGEEIGVVIKCQKEEIFDKMHRI